MVSLQESLSSTITKTKALQLADGRWEGVVDFGSYPTSLTLFMCRCMDYRTNDWHRQIANWIADQQKNDGSWGSVWNSSTDIGEELDQLIIQQVKRNTTTSVLALQLIGGFDMQIEKAQAWLQQHDFETDDPLNDMLQAINGLKPWGNLKLGDLLKFLVCDPTKMLPVWMVELVIALILAMSFHNKNRSLSPLVRLSIKRMTKLLRSRQLDNGSWFGTVDQTVYALLGFHVTDQILHRDRSEAAISFLRSKQETSRRVIQRFSLPIWDTSRMLLALKRAGFSRYNSVVFNALTYIQHSANGDNVWSFSPQTKRYPDCDDTALAFLALASFDLADVNHPSLKWLLKMQNKDGGWASFLHNQVSPINGRSELEDSSTPDVTAHVLEALAIAGYDINNAVVDRAVKYLEGCQYDDGSWYGRWGVCYIYGTSQVLKALRSLHLEHDSSFRKGLLWLTNIQNEDGGWGEHPASYYLGHYLNSKRSFPSQTALSIESLLTLLPPTNEAVSKGLQFLVDTQLPDGLWQSFPTAAAFEIYDNSIDALILPFSALAIAWSGSPENFH